MFINGILISIVPLARFANHAQPGHIVFHAEHDSLVAVGGDEVLEDAAQLGERLAALDHWASIDKISVWRGVVVAFGAFGTVKRVIHHRRQRITRRLTD